MSQAPTISPFLTSIIRKTRGQQHKPCSFLLTDKKTCHWTQQPLTSHFGGRPPQSFFYLPFVIWRKAAGFFPALLPTQKNQQAENMDFYYCEHPKYERTVLALLDSLDDGGMLLRNVALYQSTPKTRENAHKNEQLRQYRSLSSSLTQIPSGYIICTMLYKKSAFTIMYYTIQINMPVRLFDLKIPIPISHFEFSYPKYLQFPPFIPLLFNLTYFPFFSLRSTVLNFNPFFSNSLSYVPVCSFSHSFHHVSSYTSFNHNFPFPFRPQFRNQNWSVSTVTRLLARRPRSPGLIPCKGKGFISPLNRPTRLWGPPSYLFNGYRWLLTRW